jgi:hypothetical protein
MPKLFDHDSLLSSINVETYVNEYQCLNSKRMKENHDLNAEFCQLAGQRD